MGDTCSVKQFVAGYCCSYVISSGRDVLIIDPHISLVEAYSNYLKNHQFDLKYIVDTHTHADHFSSAAILKKEFNAPVLMNSNAVSDVADGWLDDGDALDLGSCHFKVIYAPGHTDDSMIIYGEGRVFTGDVLLMGSVGRTDFQNGSPESMFDTLQKLKALPDETTVFPAHDYSGQRSSTIGREKAGNSHMKETSKELFVQETREKRLPKPFNIENIIRVNQKGEAAALEMISPEEAKALASKDSNVVLLDVRSTLEFDEVHIENSINVPLDTLSSKIEEVCRPNQTCVVFCRSGNRSFMAADMLQHSGIGSVKVMEGGIVRWKKNKLDVVKGKKVVSLERQVRIVAGFLMLVGIALAGFVHTAFILISAGVACGLIFAGLTDSCMMGNLLMKLPYNKKMFKPKSGGGACALD